MTGRRTRTRVRSAALAVLALNAIGLLAYTLPRRAAEAAGAARLEATRRDLARERALLERRQAQAAAQRGNQVDLERLAKSLPPRSQALVPVLEAIEEMARSAGLRPRQRTYDEEEVPGTGIVRVVVRLPLEGRYAALVDFLGRVEEASEAVSVDSITLQGEAGQARLQVSLSAWFSAPEVS